VAAFLLFICLAQPVLRHILVPTDFSHRSEAAVSYALQLAKQTHAQLTLLQVLLEPSALDYTLGGFPEDEQDRVKEEAWEPFG
jgi:nucleotide-binding universal stress UspA family protein